MTKPTTNSIKPLVVGFPRSGKTMLISVIAEIRRTLETETSTLRRKALAVFCDSVGAQISKRIEDVFRRRGLHSDLLYNPNFRLMVGGPKWLKEDDDQLACFRKYIGVRGKGDFTLITSHPRQVLEYYDINHSHIQPARWVSHSGYADYARYSSMRHPAGTIISACFSLNALASEYIQRFVPSIDDNDLIRQRLGLYKLSDLNFFGALITPFNAYLEEFETCADSYYIMHWEDLLLQPTDTIMAVSRSLGTPVTAEQAAGIWKRIDHLNLTGAHRHNFRQGHGIVGGWRKWITNHHLDMLRDAGFDRHTRKYGYGQLESLNEADYTPFQKTLASHIAQGKIFRDYGDEDLFGFAFNKSNIDLSCFTFKRYGWRQHTQIERSTCTDDDLVMEVWDVAEASCATVNAALCHWLRGPKGDCMDPAMIGEVMERLDELYTDSDAMRQCRQTLATMLTPGANAPLQDGDRQQETGAANTRSAPILLQAVGTINIVAFRSMYYALPQNLGTVDLNEESVIGRPGVRIAGTLAGVLKAIGKYDD